MNPPPIIGGRLRFCRATIYFVLVLGTLIPKPNLHAHPDLLEQIAAVTAQFKTQTNHFDLYLHRADLFRRHAEFDAALLDLRVAEKLTVAPSQLALARARVYCDAGRAADALTNIATFLKTAPDHYEGLLIRARAQSWLGATNAAISDYDAVLKLAPAPSPDIYLERARLLANSGQLAQAVAGLDEALSNSPFASPLQLTAIEYERRRGAYEAALVRVDELIQRYPVKEPWRTLRAEVLEQAGRKDDAKQTFAQVLAGIKTYPAVRRSLELTKQLETRARQGLLRCGATNQTLLANSTNEIATLSPP